MLQCTCFSSGSCDYVLFSFFFIQASFFFFLELAYSRLTKREQDDIEYKKKVLKLAKEHRAAGEIEKIDRYYIPRDDVKPQEKYVEDKTEKGLGSEQARWEEEHLNAALMKFGAKDAKEKKSKQYDVIMDEEIEFVQALKMPGTVKDKVWVVLFP